MGSGTKVKEKKLTHQDDSDEERKSEPTSTDINASELPPHILLEMTALSPTMIKVGDILCEIEIDKATLEFESDIEAVKNSSGSRSASKNEQTTKHDTKTEVKPQKTSSKRISPAAKLLISEYGLDASTINASGPHGTLLKGDVLSAIKSGKLTPKPYSAKEKASPSQSHQQCAASPESKSASASKQSDAYEDLSNSQIRKVIAKRLLESKQNTPHLYLSSGFNSPMPFILVQPNSYMLLWILFSPLEKILKDYVDLKSKKADVLVELQQCEPGVNKRLAAISSASLKTKGKNLYIAMLMWSLT
ncbi:hypothetical protein Ahy_B01g052691 [Arachis hypogaea]|uniref:Peripheral subunit-binding (PSBD) domain-containing protein n=1 Tax=Arachis hypogaea TaxID=3818 RepID=A0A445AQ27_ARAHY|nr:hypothetical protein Ahy_B01g052691 [Arachis hypogaea]